MFIYDVLCTQDHINYFDNIVWHEQIVRQCHSLDKKHVFG